MTKTITGAEFRVFYKENWPEGAWHEDLDSDYADLIEDHLGNYILPDTAILDLNKLGSVVKTVNGREEWTPFAEVYEAFVARGEVKPFEVMSWSVPVEVRDQVMEIMAGVGAVPILKSTV